MQHVGPVSEFSGGSRPGQQPRAARQATSLERLAGLRGIFLPGHLPGSRFPGGGFPGVFGLGASRRVTCREEEFPGAGSRHKGGAQRTEQQRHADAWRASGAQSHQGEK